MDERVKILALIAGSALVGGGLTVIAYDEKETPLVVSTVPDEETVTCTAKVTHFSNWSPDHPTDDGPTYYEWACPGVDKVDNVELTKLAEGATTVRIAKPKATP